MGPLPNGRTPWLENGGAPNHLLTGMILQVPCISLCVSNDDVRFFEITFSSSKPGKKQASLSELPEESDQNGSSTWQFCNRALFGMV